MTTYLDEIYQTDELNVEYKNNIEYCPWSLNFTSINFFYEILSKKKFMVEGRQYLLNWEQLLKVIPKYQTKFLLWFHCSMLSAVSRSR